MAKLPILAVVGRPNVGKSTLFNRVIRSRKAIVDDQPGVTRDRHVAEAHWAGRDFLLMDTGGFVPEGKDQFNVAIREQVQLAIEEADMILLVGDAQTGVTEVDQLLARLIREADKPHLLVVNKVDNERLELDVGEFWKLGMDEPVPVSAISGRLTGDMLERAMTLLPGAGRMDLEGDIRVSIIGRPNVGKSSLVNRLLGEERLVVTPIAGTTRDSIDSMLHHGGRRFVLVDTAGLRRRTRIKENVEFYSSLRSQAAIQSADVCVLLIDSDEGLTKQDIQVLEEAVESRKGVLLAINKWDLVEDKDTNTSRDMEREIREQIHTLRWVEILFISALTGQRARKVLDVAWEIQQRRRVWLDRDALEESLLPEIEKRPPAAKKGKWIKIEAIRQVRSDPPWIVFNCNHPDLLEISYIRFLENRLREAFELRSVPVRLDFRRRGEFFNAFGDIREVDLRGEDPVYALPKEKASDETGPEPQALSYDGEAEPGLED